MFRTVGVIACPSVTGGPRGATGFAPSMNKPPGSAQREGLLPGMKDAPGTFA